MKEQTVESVGLPPSTVHTGVPVGAVTEDGMREAGQMPPNLMKSSGFGVGLNQGTTGRTAATHDVEVGGRRLCGFAAMGFEWTVDLGAVELRCAASNQGEIGFFSGSEGFVKELRHFWVGGEQQTTARASVQAVDGVHISPDVIANALKHGVSLTIHRASVDANTGRFIDG